jgi:dual specificity phosphatase 12
MGKSRSATIILAYLLWDSHRKHSTQNSAPKPETSSAPIPSRDTSQMLKPLTPETALALLRQGRPLAEPNDGFMEQLHLYHSMGCPDTIDFQPKYQRWLYQKTVQESLSINQAPEIDNVRFEDEHEEEADRDSETGTSNLSKKEEAEFKCRKCRRLLAKSSFLVDHHPSTPTPQAGQKQQEKKECAHLFLHPLSWMRDALKCGELDGRLACPNPKCAANVGKFAWQGMRCSCGGWVTPGFGLARGRVDEVLFADKVGEKEGVGVGVRMPPGMRRGGRHL